MRKSLGRHVVADPKICHGQPTFRGTRILVADVLEQVAQGMAWEAIEEQWRGAVSRAAIGEAVRLAGQALVQHGPAGAEESARDLASRPVGQAAGLSASRRQRPTSRRLVPPAHGWMGKIAPSSAAGAVS